MSALGLLLFFLLSVCAVYPVVVAGSDNEGELLKRIEPFQGVLGIVCVALASANLAMVSGLGTIAIVILNVKLLLGLVIGFSWLRTLLTDGEVEEAMFGLQDYVVGFGALGIALSALWVAYVGGL